MLESEWPTKPSLLVLFFAPGAGEAIRIAENRPAESGLPTEILRRTPRRASGFRPGAMILGRFFPFWPFEKMKAAEPIALDRL